MFSKVYANIAMVGNTNSGKTTTLMNCLEKCAGRKTNCMFFASAVNVDDTYDDILDMLEKKKCIVSTFDSLYDMDEDEETGQIKGKPYNLLNGIRRELQQAKEKEETRIEVPVPSKELTPKLYFGEPTRRDLEREERKIIKEEKKEETKKKKELKKRQYPEKILVFDDLGDENRDKSINKMLIKSRHFKMKCFSLLHSPINLEPSTILQLSYILIWGGFPDIQIEALYNKIGFKLPFHLFLRAYKDATSEPFNFLYIDRPKTELRKNFDMKYDFTDMDDEEDESKESSDSE